MVLEEVLEVAAAVEVVSDPLSSDDGVVSGSLSVTVSLSDEVTEDSSVVSELTDVTLKAVVTEGSADASHEAMTKRRLNSADKAIGFNKRFLMRFLFLPEL